MKRTHFLPGAGAMALALTAPPLASSANSAAWQQLLAAGKKEGSVAVIGGVDPLVRRLITEQFFGDTGIKVSYEGIEGTLIAPRIEREAAAGQITVDVLISGSAELRSLYPKGLLSPIKPILVMPEDEDPTKWADNHIEYTDKDGQYFLRTVSGVYGGMVINTKNLSKDALKTSADLLKPQYKGKIVSSPYQAGSGSGFAANVLYRQKVDYFTKLYKGQEVVFLPNSRGVVEQVARGTYLIGFGIFPFEVEEFKKAGFPLEVVYATDLPGYLSASNGTVKLIKNSPHPSAGAVFVNWFASRKTQESLMKVTLDPSRRKDVKPTLVPSYTLPKPGIDYLDQHQYEFYVNMRGQVLKDVEEILGR